MKRLVEISKQELEELYNNKVMAISAIAEQYHCDPETIRRKMIKYKIPRRSASETAYLKKRITRVKEITVEDLRDFRKVLDMYDDVKIFPRKQSEDEIINIILPTTMKEKDEIVITLVLSDLHLGDANFLPDTFKSCVSNLQTIVKFYSDMFVIKRFNIICNGDIVSGREVYRFQSLRNLLQRGHWQVFLAEVVMKKLIQSIPLHKDIIHVYLCKGTHENLSENYLLYLKKALLSDGFNTYYLSHSKVLDVGDPLGSYYVYFTHGFGKSDFPVSPSLVKDLYRAIAQYKEQDITVQRACCAHTHWLASNIYYQGLTIDVTGGFQKWEYTNSQRPAGMILYIFNKGLSCMEIKPSLDIERNERREPALEYKNLIFYGNMLYTHAKEIEGIKVVKVE